MIVIDGRAANGVAPRRVRSPAGITALFDRYVLQSAAIKIGDERLLSN